MKIGLMFKLATTLLLVCSFTLTVFAQGAKKQRVTKDDKKAIIEIFKDVDPAEYRLVFKNGKEVHGNKHIKMNDLKVVGKSSRATSKSVKWTFIVGDRSKNEVFYIYTEGSSKMVSLLGVEKMAALQRIADKYEDVKVGN